MKGRYDNSSSVKKNAYWTLLNRNWFSSCKWREFQAVQRSQQETSGQFCETPACNYCFVCHIQLYMYHVLQMRENESKYGFYCQNPAHFPWIFKFFIDNSSISLKQCLLGEFHGQKLETILNVIYRERLTLGVVTQKTRWWPYTLMIRGLTPAGGNFFPCFFGRFVFVFFVLFCFVFF